MSLLPAIAIKYETRAEENLVSHKFLTKPLVTEIKGPLRRYEPWFRDLLAFHGYRRAHVDYSMRIETWVRPLPLWLLFRAYDGYFDLLWSAMGWLFSHRVIHTSAPTGTAFRWRDLRVGSDPRGCV